ncbi:MAG: DUF362 domain-containing protein [Desulfobulbaceae bacterium]|nr:DUF362 domain-containing protein [Desulfobulbaceae bacterium]
MHIAGNAVAVSRCCHYRRESLKDAAGNILAAAGVSVRAGDAVLLKPNLISGRRRDGLPCTDPLLVAAVAEWFCDHGARVAVGDSPAFGSAEQVMRACGYDEALRGLPVRRVNFSRPRSVRLACGETVGVAVPALECDFLVNLPKVKAHCQMLVSLAVKNYFGVVVGWRKPWLHAKHGDMGNRFEEMLVDLLAVLPAGVSLADGVVAMHKNGPVQGGEPYPLGVLAGSVNPVALESGLLRVLGVEPGRSPVWRECRRRGLPGSDPDALAWSLEPLAAVQAADFLLPQVLQPVSFRPQRLLSGAVKRLMIRIGL